MTRSRTAILATLTLVTAGCSAPPTGPVDGPPDGAPETESFGVEQAVRPFLPGEQQPAVDLSRGTYAVFPAGAGQNLVQTFRPRRKQYLGEIRVPVGCVAGVLLNVKVRAGIGGRILFEGNTRGLPEIVDGTFQNLATRSAARPRGVKLKKNRTYAIEFASFPPGPLNTCGIAKGPTGDSYARGQGFFEDVPTNGPGYLPLPNGAAGDQEDLPFITIVR